MSMPRRASRYLLMLALGLLSAACAPRAATITVDPAQKFQVMRGWEVAADVGEEDGSGGPAPYSGALYDLVVNDVGVNRLRLEVRSGAENTDGNWRRYHAGEISYEQWRPLRYVTINDNDDPHTINWEGFDFSELDYTVETLLLPMRERLEARGERLFVNLCYVAFTKQIRGGPYIHDRPEEYAEFVLAAYMHLRDTYGFVPDSMEPVLEPDLVKQWSPRLLGEAIAATARRLRENGFTPAFVAPSTTDMAHAVPWLEGIAEVDGALDPIVEISYHRYRNASAQNARAIAAVAARYGKATAMTELWFGRATPDVLYEDLTVANVSSWQGRASRGVAEIEESDGAPARLSVNAETRFTRQYFQNVRFGAQRVGASAPRSVRPSAFVNPDGSFVVIADVDHAMNLTIRGAPGGAYRARYVLADGKLVTLGEPIVPDADGALYVRMPGKGIIAITRAPDA